MGRITRGVDDYHASIRRYGETRNRPSMGIVGVVVTIILVAVFVVIVWGDDDEVERVMAETDYSGIPTNGMTLGDPDAPVTLVEYADFRCIDCATFANDTKPQLIDDFVRSGEVRLEFRPMALPGTDIDDPESMAVRSAEAAMCAADQDQFWPYHERLYDPIISENILALDEDFMRDVADDLELDREQFDTCLDENTHRQAVLDSYEQGAEAGLQLSQLAEDEEWLQLPAVSVNGNPLVSAGDEQGQDELRSQIESALDAE